MKSISALILLVSVCLANCGLSPEQFEKLVGYSKACREETGATLEMVTRAVSGEFLDDPKLKAQLFCISKKIGFQDDAGKMNGDVLKEKINTILKDPAKTDELIAKCAVERDSPEESAFQSIKCYFQERGINFVG